ncbi:cfem domain-containing protein [Teratosphaeria destructans]|uniref:Cfem domain-containing protein n=1 Tax=Teratosphaeria destructans TaxID=418781 RepID=A0A9W7VYE5_9PEZI|nr:cfem domain-containing protein [Teratosphaeria destructans]
MQLACWVLTSALLTRLSIASATAASTANSTSISESLLECGANCFSIELARSTCRQADATCLCDDESLLKTTRSCTVVNCTLDEVVTWEKYRAATCAIPVRDRSQVILGIEWSLFSIAVLAVAIRLIARTTITGGHGLDDALVVISLSLLVMMASMQTLMVKYGFGKDIWGVPLDNIPPFLLYQWICILIYIPQVTTMKMSIIFVYLRIFPATVSRFFRLFCWLLIGAGCFFIFLSTIIFTFACNPVSLSWHGLYRHHQAQCINVPAVYYLALSINLGADFIVFVMPIPKILMLESMSRRNKIVTSLMFLLGLAVTVASTVRLAWITSFIYSTNFTYDHADFDILSFIEDSLGIVCACIPTSASLCRHIVRKFRGQFSTNPSIASLPKSPIKAKISDAHGGITVLQSFSHRRSRRSHVGSRPGEEDDEFELVDGRLPELRSDHRGLRYEVNIRMGVPSLRSVPSEMDLERASADQVCGETKTLPKATYFADG